MKKILFLPLLQMQSGHHQVAEAIMDMLKAHTDDITVKKMDLLSYTNESLEKMITSSYLKWIRYAPKTYNFAYKSFFYVPQESGQTQTFKWYQHIFLKKLEKMLVEEAPDLIVCTHGFPSYLLSKLKMKGKCHVPVINVYTDFFINSVWGREGIDFHLLPTQDAKELLQKKYKISPQKMIVTGIPVHEEMNEVSTNREQNVRHKVLISGGNSGLGGLLKLTEGLKDSTQFDYYILCGKNKKLYEDILSRNIRHIKPLPYISSRSEMNKLYEDVDAIVTKPGGVTVSEALKKRLPIFVNSVLPGQEQINLDYLKEKGLIFPLEDHSSLEEQLTSILKDEKKMVDFKKRVNAYQKDIELGQPQSLVEMIQSILEQQTSKNPSYHVKKPSVLQWA